MPRPGRPTEQCLQSLDTEWNNADHARHAATPQDCPIPLDALDHPIIAKAAEDFPGDGSDAGRQRESISGLPNPVWWKAKIGSRWRGAVHVDDEGQAWLCAAGYRREGERHDFYRQFMDVVLSRGPEVFLPSDADRERLKREQKSEAFEGWERGLHASVLDATLASLEDGQPRTVAVDLPMGGDLVEVLIECNEEEGSEDEVGLVEVVVQFTVLNWEHQDVMQWVELVVLTAIQPREQAWDTASVGSKPTHSLLFDADELPGFVEQMRSDRSPGQVSPGDSAHYSHKGRIVDGAVNGEGIKALCGVWFVPRQDHHKFETCSECDAIYRMMR